MPVATPKRKRKDSEEPKIDTSVMNDEIVSEDGSIRLFLTMDILTIQRNRDQYADALMMSRGLPFDIDLVQASDPIALYVAQQRPALQQRNPNFAVNQARQYYRQHIHNANRDAMMLAILVDKRNNPALSGEPKPYDEGEPEELPGLLYIPDPVRNLTDPVEARLRNFFQVLEDNPEMVTSFYVAFNNSMARLAQAAGSIKGDSNEVDEQGFQP